MKTRLSKEQRFLCGLLGEALTGERCRGLTETVSQTELKTVIQTAKRHKVLPLLYEVLCEDWQGVPLDAADKKQVENLSRVTVRQSYRLLFLTRFLVKRLEGEGVPVLVLKGSGAAALYPVPEARKSGDIDLLVPEGKLELVKGILAGEGFDVKQSQHANHHLAFCSGDGIDAELHTMLAEPFRNEEINRYMDRLLRDYFRKKVYKDCMGVSLPLPAEPYQALQLLLHMLQHFLRAGFGLKLLCDWVVFWNRDEVQGYVPEFLGLVEGCHIREFSDTITMVCKEFLGLRQDLPMGGRRDGGLAEEFLSDVFAAEEFGEADKDRMVIVEGKGPWAYVREFHYQMKMNHPKTSRHILLWPALWVVTLAVFLRNNRRLKRGKVKDILRSAGDRSKLLRQMGLDQ